MCNNPDDPKLFDDLAPQQKSELLQWISDSFYPIKSFTTIASSYGIKQRFDHTHFYIYNGVFKGAMLAAGYKAKNPDDKNWYFNISKKSNYFKVRE